MIGCWDAVKNHYFWKTEFIKVQATLMLMCQLATYTNAFGKRNSGSPLNDLWAAHFFLFQFFFIGDTTLCRSMTAFFSMPWLGQCPPTEEALSEIRPPRGCYFLGPCFSNATTQTKTLRGEFCLMIPAPNISSGKVRWPWDWQLAERHKLFSRWREFLRFLYLYIVAYNDIYILIVIQNNIWQ